MRSTICAALLVVILAGCQAVGPTASPVTTETPTPFQPSTHDAAPGEATPTTPPLPSPVVEVVPEATLVPGIWIDPLAPAGLASAAQEAAGLPAVGWDQAAVRFELVQPDQAGSWWVFALTAPFPTLTDEISLAELQQAWLGNASAVFSDRALLVPAESLELLSTRLGTPAVGSVQPLPEDELLAAAWESGAFAIVPFQQLEPRWKVLRIDGLSPLPASFDAVTYPLAFAFGFAGAPAPESPPPGNRDPQRLTTLVMTGVTALVRATAYQMEISGVEFPARDTGSWLRAADVTHISNEVSFFDGCPEPNPVSELLYFCSQPEYFELLRHIGADVIELTGNHLNDAAVTYDVDTMPYNLDLYAQAGMQVYGGGADLFSSRKAAQVEHNGNRMAFIGCNSAGPPHAWATETSPGAAPCSDFDWLHAEIERLAAGGYLPVVTFQFVEDYGPVPGPRMQEDFLAAASAGAVIVQGSQAHTPKALDFRSGGLVHYGLGNLFFDQMDVDLAYLQVGNQFLPYTRFEFIDRHTIYDGRLINTELLTAVLEDYARPRPATPQERAAFLTDIFETSGWRVFP